MSIWAWVFIAIAIYLAIGVLVAIYVLQKPYAILLWPLYFFMGG